MTKEIKTRLQHSRVISLNDVKAIKKLAGDASSREFYRVMTDNNQSYILMALSEGNGPLVTGKIASQTDSFIELAMFLQDNNINVPKLYESNLEEGYCLLEDLGDRQLASVLNTNNQKQSFSKATSLISKIQNIKQDDSSIIFNRNVSFDNLFEESKRFITFYLTDVNISKKELEVIVNSLKNICKQVFSQVQVPVFRDYIAWNIMIKDEDLYLVDFQDIAIGNYSYDLVSLLHDRDVDQILGDDLINFLIGQFMSENKLSSQFINDYYHSLLQRHFRLAGQFVNLTKITGKQCYQNWAPGSLNRIGRALGALEGQYEDLKEVLMKHVPEIEEGIRKPYDFGN